MVAKYYQSGNVWLSSALHGHFVVLYSAFKLGICNLSLRGNSKKCTTVYEKGDDDMEDYLDSLNNLLQSHARKYQSKKWWSHDVVEMIFPLYFAYTNE
jgi:hypothetical protein